MYISLSDTNLSEAIKFEATRTELTRIMQRAGSWQPSPDGGGNILLDDPFAMVYAYDPGFDDWHPEEDSSYPDWLVTIGPRDGVRWTRA